MPEAVTTTELPQKQQQQSQGHLMLGILVWFLHQNLVYQFNSVACKWAFLTSPAGGLTVLQWVELAVTLLALILMGYLIYRPWQAWSSTLTTRSRPLNSPRMLRDTEQDRGGFMAFLAMGLNTFFLLFLVASIVVVLGLNACGQA